MQTHGKLYVIEGLDGSGKQTQTQLLVDRLREKFPGQRIIQMSFPNYGNPSSVLVEEYLAKSFDSAEEYFKAANIQMQWVWGVSMMYALDRFATFMQVDSETGKTMLQLYHDGAIIITDRYTSSNIVHQAPLHPSPKLYVKQLERQEYEYLGIPKPETVFFLETTPQRSMENIIQRNQQLDKLENLKDLSVASTSIHKLLNDTLDWTVIKCMGNRGEMLDIKLINDRIFSHVLSTCSPVAK